MTYSKRIRILFLPACFLAAAFLAVPAQVFAETYSGNESGKTGALNRRGLADKEKVQHPYDAARVTEASEKKRTLRAHTLRNSHQRPSDWIEDTPLGSATS